MRAGAKLAEADKEKLKALNAELATLSATFNQNVLKEVAAAAVLVDTRAELAGLSEAQIAAAADAAKARGPRGQVPAALDQHQRPAPAGLPREPGRCARR